MIIYFTGTENSTFIANNLADGLADEIVNAGSFIRRGEYPTLHSETPYIFITPVYAWQMPRVFCEWIEKSSFTGSDKGYFVIHCGSSIGAAGERAEQIWKGKGLTYMGTAQVKMPENYLIMFNTPSEEKSLEILAEARPVVAALVPCVKAEEPFPVLRVGAAAHLSSGIVNKGFYKFYIKTDKFYATESCISCGKCVEDCVLNNITLVDGKPVWGQNCTHCVACICKCPTGAIEYGSKTRDRRRYVCPEER